MKQLFSSLAVLVSAAMISFGIGGVILAPAYADLTYTQGSGTTIFDFTCFTSKHCSAHALIDSAGNEIGSQILTAVQAAIPAGTNTIGNVNPAPNITATDCSGTIATGGTAQNAFSAQTTLHGFTIVNIDTSEPLWISFTTTASASGTGSYPLQAATATTFSNPGSFTTPPGFGLNHALSVIATTTSHKYSCTFW